MGQIFEGLRDQTDIQKKQLQVMEKQGQRRPVVAVPE